MNNPAMNDIQAVRTALFETLRGLSNKESPMDIDRAKAVNEVAQTIINSAKVEVDAIRVLGGKGSGFIPLPEPSEKPKKSSTGGRITETPGRTVHTL